MSANLDLVRSIYVDWERGDLRATDWAHPDIEWVTVGGLEPGRATGLAAIEERSRDFRTALGDIRLQAEEYRELDDERILVLTRDTARGRTSGVDTVQRRARLFHLQGGKVTRIISYWDRDRALADLGIES